MSMFFSETSPRDVIRFIPTKEKVCTFVMFVKVNYVLYYIF